MPDLFAATSAPTMPCISLWQPYASLIACGAKPWETRDWHPGDRFIGQRIAIHATKRRPTKAEIEGLDEIVQDVFGCHWSLRLPYGAIVCTAILAGAFWVEHYDEQGPILQNYGRIKDDGFGDYHCGRWCWRLTEVRELPEPLPCNGHQGWWNTQRISDA